MNLQLCFMNETASEFEALPNQDIPRPTPPVAVPITLPKSTSMVSVFMHFTLYKTYITLFVNVLCICTIKQ
jgi:hypothetical protein